MSQHFDWITPMRAQDDEEARAADQLRGQAGMIRHEDGRITLITMPDLHTFSASATISAEDARELARMIMEGQES